MTEAEEKAKELREKLKGEFPLGQADHPAEMVSVPRKKLSDTMWSLFNAERSLERIYAIVGPIHNEACGGIPTLNGGGHIMWEDCVKKRLDWLRQIESEYRRLKLIEGEMERMQWRLESVLKGEDPDR